MNKSTAERITGKVLSYLVFFCFAAVTILPFLWMTSTAFKFEQDVFRFPIEWIPSSIRWKNFQDVFKLLLEFNQAVGHYYSADTADQLAGSLFLCKTPLSRTGPAVPFISGHTYGAMAGHHDPSVYGNLEAEAGGYPSVINPDPELHSIWSIPAQTGIYGDFRGVLPGGKD